MKLWKQINEKAVGILAGILITAIVSFGTFAFHLYDTIEHIVPEMGLKVAALDDTVKQINARPAIIEGKVNLMKQDIDNIKRDVEGIKQSQIRQQLTNEKIYLLLIQIKNGN